MPIPKTALEYFREEKNRHTEPYQKFYDEAIAALEGREYYFDSYCFGQPRGEYHCLTKSNVEGGV